MPFEGIEVAITMKETVSRLNAKRRNKTIDSLADSVTVSPQYSVVLS